jgi:hypothetical protein
MFIHGNAVVVKYPGGNGLVGSPHTAGHQMNGVNEQNSRINWSDIVGLRDVSGATFTGRENQTNTFFAAIPTPVWRAEGNDTRNGNHAKLARVVVNFTTQPDVLIDKIHVSDGPRMVPFSFPLGGRAVGYLTGEHSHTWQENTNYFDYPDAERPTITSCVGIAFEVLFRKQGDIQFNVIGCDFLI